MTATRMCPRCQTENDVACSRCDQCGGVMLGVDPPAQAAPSPPVAAARVRAPAAVVGAMVVLGMGLALSLFLFLQVPRPVLPPPVAPPPPVPAPVIAADHVALDKLRAALVGARAPAPEPTTGGTLTRAQLVPLHACFHGRGHPTERPMSFGIALEQQGAVQTVTIVAMSEVEVPAGVRACLTERVPAERWPNGVWFADWPLDPTWP